MTNHISEVAAILGVGLNERFRLSGSKEKYYFTESGLFYEDFQGRENCRADLEVWEGIMRGDFVIGKIWKPKEGERFYIPCVNTGKPDCFIDTWHCNSQSCKRLLDAGMVCRNKEEAEAKAERMIRSILLY